MKPQTKPNKPTYFEPERCKLDYETGLWQSWHGNRLWLITADGCFCMLDSAPAKISLHKNIVKLKGVKNLYFGNMHADQAVDWTRANRKHPGLLRPNLFIKERTNVTTGFMTKSSKIMAMTKNDLSIINFEPVFKLQTIWSGQPRLPIWLVNYLDWYVGGGRATNSNSFSTPDSLFFIDKLQANLKPAIVKNLLQSVVTDFERLVTTVKLPIKSDDLQLFGKSVQKTGYWVSNQQALDLLIKGMQTLNKTKLINDAKLLLEPINRSHNPESSKLDWLDLKSQLKKTEPSWPMADWPTLVWYVISSLGKQ